ncbi:MAG: ABC transporter ATP-binding protein [Candidatus Kapabacteria bacterium]|nr:ABC transporter ATP-binding protein [Candidatus Kapabacteria bacterium]
MSTEKTEQNKKKVDFSMILRLLTYIKPYRSQVFIASLCTLIATAVNPLRPYLIKQAIDTAIPTKDWELLQFYGILIFSMLIVNGVLQYLMSLIMARVGERSLYDIRVKLFAHIHTLSQRYYDKTPLGRLITRVTNDVEALLDLFSSGVVMIVADILLITWIVVFMFLTSWKLTIATVMVLPILFIASSIFQRKVRVVYTKVRTEISKMNSFLNEFISGIITVKLFNKEKEKFDEFEQINNRYTKLQIKTISYYAVFFPVVELLSTLALAISLWFTARDLLIGGDITIGVLVAFTQYSAMFFRPVRELTEQFNTLQSALAASERIFELLDTKEQIEIKENAKEFTSLKDSIEFSNVTFSYDSVQTVLDSVSFSVKKGETVAIVGATGSGKTTIINLLCRFYDFSQGSIMFDGTDIRNFTPESIRSKTSLVIQDVFLFSRTIKENITLGNESITQEQIELATKQLGASEFIEALPMKYETSVKERGVTLSVGQKQLISFCRALVTNPEILILDEATSSIDSETEQIIERSLETLMKGRTSIIIAHRLSTIQKADKIIVLHHGVLREQGTHKELLELDGLYATLHKIQYKENNVFTN